MAEPQQKKKKQSQWDMCNITLDKIKWFQSRPTARNWRKFSKIKILYVLVTGVMMRELCTKSF